MAIGVGLMVYFASPRGGCDNQCPTVRSGDGGAPQTPPPGEDQVVWDKCKSLSAARNECK